MTRRGRERAPAPAEGAGKASEVGTAGRPRRGSAKQNQEAMLRLLRGEALLELARERAERLEALAPDFPWRKSER